MSSRKHLLIPVLIAGLLTGGIGYFVFFVDDGPPAGLAVANGRIEAQRIDVATKFAGRLAEILVSEGDRVEAGQILARLEDAQIRARLREAEAQMNSARQTLAERRAVLAERESNLVFADKELHRAQELSERGFTPLETVDLRLSQRESAAAGVTSAQAGISAAEASIEAAQATVDRLRADLEDHALRAPRAGRVQYRLAEPGEVLAAGARVLTLIDLTDVVMTVYLPTGAAGRLAYGAEARLVLDAAPEYVIPAQVSFVAGEAQFTPKYVETEEERENLMFRVKLRIPPEILADYEHVVKTGVPGVAHVRVDPSVAWPASLAVRLPNAR